MKIELEIPAYSSTEGLKLLWTGDFSITTSGTASAFIISANKAGLISLATHLLTLAQEEVPTGCHFHYDESNSLEDGAIDLIVQKTD